jgi:DNA-binding SARP family transcriptional activator
VTTATHQALVAWEDRTVPPVRLPLEIRLLGSLQVTRRGQTIPEAAWGSERAKALLVYLLWKGPAGASREELSAALWPDRSVEEAANVFHVTLHRLRRALEPKSNRQANYILHQRGTYRFNSEAAHWLDVTTFRRLVTTDTPESLQAAVALYRGPYLADAGWVLPPEVEIERQALEQLYVSALRQLIAQLDSRAAGPYLEKLLAIEPADETAHRLLTLGYLARGRRDLARRQVARWRQALAEVELRPTAEIRALWEKVEQNAKRGKQGG